MGADPIPLRKAMRAPRSAAELEILAQLRAISAELKDLREAHDHLLRRLLEQDDRRVGSALVPLLAHIFADKSFTAAEISIAALSNTLTGQALSGLVGEQLTEMRAFGKLLARLEGVPFGKHRLVADGQWRGVRRWMVLTPSKPSPGDTLREGD